MWSLFYWRVSKGWRYNKPWIAIYALSKMWDFTQVLRILQVRLDNKIVEDYRAVLDKAMEIFNKSE